MIGTKESLLISNKKPQSNGEVALVFIYNERFAQNIPIIEAIYKGRFTNIFHLIPDYDSRKENVIKVKGSKHFFHSFISQGFNTYYKSSFRHYIFLADDMLLNPNINERNYRKYFNIKEGQSFITSLNEMTADESIRSQHSWLVCWGLLPYACNTKTLKSYIGTELPSYNQAIYLCKKRGFNTELFNQNAKHNLPFGYAIGQVYIKKYHSHWLNLISSIFRKVFLFRKLESYQIELKLKRIRRNYLQNMPKIAYPIISGYSDIVVISAHEIKNFSAYCKCFAKSELYVEMAIPTALLLTDSSIKTEKDTKLKMFREWPWASCNIQEFADKTMQLAREYNSKKEAIMKVFPKNFLYIHPIKLSAWDINKI